MRIQSLFAHKLVANAIASYDDEFKLGVEPWRASFGSSKLALLNFVDVDGAIFWPRETGP